MKVTPEQRREREWEGRGKGGGGRVKELVQRLQAGPEVLTFEHIAAHH